MKNEVNDEQEQLDLASALAAMGGVYDRMMAEVLQNERADLQGLGARVQNWKGLVTEDFGKLLVGDLTVSITKGDTRQDQRAKKVDALPPCPLPMARLLGTDVLELTISRVKYQVYLLERIILFLQAAHRKDQQCPSAAKVGWENAGDKTLRLKGWVHPWEITDLVRMPEDGMYFQAQTNFPMMSNQRC